MPTPVPSPDPADCLAVTTRGVTFILHELDGLYRATFRIIAVKGEAIDRDILSLRHPDGEVGKLIDGGPSKWVTGCWRYHIATKLQRLGKMPPPRTRAGRY